MDGSIIAALITGSLTLLIAISQGVYIWMSKKKEKEEKLQEELNALLELTVQYPYLEHPTITEHWIENKDKALPRFMRYDQFCNLLFNHLSHVYNFYEGNVNKIENFVDVKSWVRLHEQNWKSPLIRHENRDAYDKDFRDFIDDYLKD